MHAIIDRLRKSKYLSWWLVLKLRTENEYWFDITLQMIVFKVRVHKGWKGCWITHPEYELEFMYFRFSDISRDRIRLLMIRNWLIKTAALSLVLNANISFEFEYCDNCPIKWLKINVAEYIFARLQNIQFFSKYDHDVISMMQVYERSSRTYW